MIAESYVEGPLEPALTELNDCEPGELHAAAVPELRTVFRPCQCTSGFFVSTFVWQLPHIVRQLANGSRQ